MYSNFKDRAWQKSSAHTHKSCHGQPLLCSTRYHSWLCHSIDVLLEERDKGPEENAAIERTTSSWIIQSDDTAYAHAFQVWLLIMCSTQSTHCVLCTLTLLWCSTFGATGTSEFCWWYRPFPCSQWRPSSTTEPVFLHEHDEQDRPSHQRPPSNVIDALAWTSISTCMVPCQSESCGHV